MELRKLVLAQVRATRSGEDWARWLRLAVRLRGHSFANVLLIAAQRPDARLVATGEQWQVLGRRVGKGERGILVVAEPGAAGHPAAGDSDPGIPDSAAVKGNRGRRRAGPQLVHLWDVTQTSGAALPSRPRTGGPPPGAWEALTWLGRREGFAVEREHPGHGDAVMIWAARRIRVRPELGDADAVAALAHELGHLLLRRPAMRSRGASTAGCRGVRKAEAVSVAFVVCARLGIDAGGAFPYVASWAGTDPRAGPEAAVLAAGERIVAAAEQISAHLDTALPTPFMIQPGIAQLLAFAAEPPSEAARHRAPAAIAPAPATPGTDEHLKIGGEVSKVLADAEQFFADRLETSWVPAYLRDRGFASPVVGEWRIGYAPAGWATLTNHLYRLGHDDTAIIAAGLARRSARGTLIDHFRDRAMLAIRDEHGAIAGFIGRAHPDAEPAVPKYLNSPDTVAYKKGDLLFGLSEARAALAVGAIPVITEGPFDALAVTIADGGQYIGVAPCGTALTERQVTTLTRFANLHDTGVLVALDGDRPGRQGAIRAYGILRHVTAKAVAVVLPEGRDPAEILKTEGPSALVTALRDRTQPLATLIVDAWLDHWGRRLEDPAGQLYALRDAAARRKSIRPVST